MLRPPTVKKKCLIHTEEEFLDFINEYNGVRNIYVNLYHFRKSECCSSFYYFDKKDKKYRCNKCKNVIQWFDLSSFVIDSVVFDIDPSPNTNLNRIECFLKAKRLSKYFSDFERYVIKSGKGFHFYIRTEPIMDNDFKHGGKNAIKKFQIEVEKMFGKTDWITHGDTSQMIRVPGTFNVGSRTFCLCLTENHLKSGFRKLEEISKIQPQIKVEPIGFGKLINLKDSDEKVESYDFIHEGELLIDFKESKDKTDNLRNALKVYGIRYDKMSNCVKTMMNNEFLDYRQRFLLINILKNLGVSEKDCEKIISIVLFSKPEPSSKDEKRRYDWAHHCINGERQLYYIYTTDYGMPACKSGISLGFEILGLCSKCQVKNIMSYK